MQRLWPAFLVILSLLAFVPCVSWANGSDDFESYAANTDLLAGSGASNGEITWVNSGGTIFETDRFVAVVEGTAPSGSQVAQFTDQVTSGFASGYWDGVLATPNSIFIAPGQSATMALDFRYVAGFNLDINPLFAAWSNGNAIDTIENVGGFRWIARLPGGNVGMFDEDKNWLVANPLDSIQVGNWYRLEQTITRNGLDAAQPGMYRISSVVSEVGGQQVGDVVTTGSETDGLRLAGRPFLQGLRINNSSDPNEIHQFDNVSFTKNDPGLGTGVTAAADNFDGVPGPAPQNLLGTTNGQMSWQTPAPGRGPLTNGTVETSSTTPGGSGQSLKFVSDNDSSGGSFFTQLAPANALELAEGDSARISFDFQTVGDQNSHSFDVLFATNEFGGSIDRIDSTHMPHIGDNGAFGLGPNSTLLTLFSDPESGETVKWSGQPYQPDQWYTAEIEVTRPVAGTYDMTFRISDFENGAVLGELFNNDLRDAGRPFVVGLGVNGSSNPAETLLMDNLVFELISTAPPGGVPGDYNNNGTVDAADYTLWQDTLGQNVTAGTGADGVPDGIISGLDYTFWKTRFGNTSGTGSTSAVPEPASLVLLLLVGLLRAGYHRR